MTEIEVILKLSLQKYIEFINVSCENNNQDLSNIVKLIDALEKNRVLSNEQINIIEQKMIEKMNGHMGTRELLDNMRQSFEIIKDILSAIERIETLKLLSESEKNKYIELKKQSSRIDAERVWA